MTLDLATLTTGRRQSIDWSNTGALPATVWSIFQAGWDVATYIPFDSTASAAGENPTGYNWNGRRYEALTSDCAVVRFDPFGDERSQRWALWDVLWQSQVMTANTTINSATLPARDAVGGTNGVGCELVLFNAATQDIAVTYTNSAGTGSLTSTITGGVLAGPQMFSLNAGDQGVKSVQSCTTTGASSFRLAILRRVAFSSRVHYIAGSTAQVFGEHATSRLHNVSVVKSGAVLFPTAASMGNTTARTCGASVELVGV